MAQIINYAMDSNEASNSGKNLSWKQGKRLGEVEFVVDGNVTKAYSYYYDESGRIKKIDQGSGNYIKYHYDSDNLEYEEHYANNSLSYLIKYFYDDQDRVQFALYKNRNFSISEGSYNLYTYVYNGLGEITDIVKVRNGLSPSASSISNLPVAHYEYDPYGNIVSINTYNDDTFGNINPIRYKAYYYDTDLGWYNLGSRYYDPSVGRFINCDNIGVINNNVSDIENKNLYAYCNNNPVMYYDDGGDVPVIIVYMLVSGIVNVAIDHTCAIIAGEDYSLTDGLLSFVCGAASINKKADYAIMGLQLGYDVFVKNSSVGDALFNTACSVGTRKVSDNISKALDISIPQTKKEVFSLALVDSTVTGGLKMAGSAGSNFLPRTPSLNVRFPKIKIRTCSIKYKKRVHTRSNLKFLFRKQFRLMRKK